MYTCNLCECVYVHVYNVKTHKQAKEQLFNICKPEPGILAPPKYTENCYSNMPLVLLCGRKKWQSYPIFVKCNKSTHFQNFV